MSRPKRVKKTVQPPESPPDPPRDPRLVALAEQAQRAGWITDWISGSDFGWWLRVQRNGVKVDAFVSEHGALAYYASSELWSLPARTPTEALRAAYAQLGVALDQAEDAFGGAP